MNNNDIFNICLAKKLSGGGGGGTDNLNAFFDRTITKIDSDTANEHNQYTVCTGCKDLVEVNFSNLRGFQTGHFRMCTSLQKVSIPNCTALSSQMFASCTSLRVLDLPKVTSIGTSCFTSSGIEVLILRNNGVVVLPSSNPDRVFLGSPFYNSTGGKIYVPEELVSEYKSNTGWHIMEALNNEILAIEGSPYENP